jgi:ribosomal protein S12 methylthiotransferase accessory factor YcaO
MGTSLIVVDSYFVGAGVAVAVAATAAAAAAAAAGEYMEKTSPEIVTESVFESVGTWT